MSRAARASLLGLCAVLLGVGLMQPDPRRQLGPTTFGTTPVGYQAVFELGEALGLPVQRSYAAPAALPADATVWWIEPTGVCQAAPASGAGDAAVEPWGGGEWIAGGGTAVVFLPPPDDRSEGCAWVGGVAVPARTAATGDGEAGMTQEVDGPLVARSRRIEAPALSAFADGLGAEVLASLGGRPFVLLQRLGAGRLVLVADARFLRNRWLDRADAAPLAMDLVRGFGVPRFDERSHGLHRERQPLRFLLGSPAALPLAGALALALLFVWAGRALPPRTLPETAAAAPALDEFVASLARLYAATGDHRRVLERYRQVAASRLRRHFGLPPETPLAVLIDRLARSGRIDAAGRARLTDTAAPADAAALRGAVRALDAVVCEATR